LSPKRLTNNSIESIIEQIERNHKIFSLTFDFIFFLSSIICIIAACFFFKKYIRRKVSNISTKLENFHLFQQSNLNTNPFNHDLS
jgi:hypothetical protein